MQGVYTTINKDRYRIKTKDHKAAGATCGQLAGFSCGVSATDYLHLSCSTGIAEIICNTIIGSELGSSYEKLLISEINKQAQLEEKK